MWHTDFDLNIIKMPHLENRAEALFFVVFYWGDIYEE